MSLQITVDYLPAKERLDALFALTGDLFPAMSAIGMEMENRVRGRFETETDPLGLPWGIVAIEADRYAIRVRGMAGALVHITKAVEQLLVAILLFADPESGTIAPDDELAIIDIVELLFLKPPADVF